MNHHPNGTNNSYYNHGYPPTMNQYNNNNQTTGIPPVQSPHPSLMNNQFPMNGSVGVCGVGGVGSVSGGTVYQQQINHPTMMMMMPTMNTSPYQLRGELVVKLHNPFSIKLLPKSNTLIMVDGNSSKVIMKDASTGIVKEEFTVTTGSVKGIGVDLTDDSFYVISGKLLIKYDYRGVYLGKFAKKLNLNNPYGCTVDENGNVYICDYNDCKIVVLSREGQLVNKIEFSKPYDIVFDNLNKFLIVTDQQKDCIRILTKNGQEIRKIGDKGNAKGQFSSPSGICIDGNSQIFVADYGNHRVQIFDINGKFLNCFGSKGSSDLNFDLPRSVCVDMGGNLYVAEYGNTRVQIFKKL